MFPQPDWTDGRDGSANLYSTKILLSANIYLICCHCHPHPNETAHYIKYHTQACHFYFVSYVHDYYM